jgi:penicillin-binding protein 1A
MAPNSSDPEHGMEPEDRADRPPASEPGDDDSHRSPDHAEPAAAQADGTASEAAGADPHAATEGDAPALDAEAAESAAGRAEPVSGEPGAGSAEAEPATAGDGSGGTGSKASGRAGSRKRFRGSARDRFRRLGRSRVFWAMVGVLLIFAVAWQRCGLRGCPAVSRLASYQPGGASVLLDRTGQVFADLGPVDHTVVEIESLPDYVPAAFVAVEDKRFYHHHGVDWRRVFGAAIANVRAGRRAQGSSTISMQLSRNVFPERIRASDRTLRRKLLEVRVARDIEKRFTKSEILELYLNHIYFGAGAYGIEAAARQYFGRAAKDLTLEQAATLAALPKAPSHYDPRHNPTASKARRDLVLALMSVQGLISDAQRQKAAQSKIRVASPRNARDDGPRAAWFVQVVRDLLEERLGEDLYSQPLRIHTTIDLRAQRAAEEQLEAQLRRVENGNYGGFHGPKLAQYKPGSGSTDYLQGAAVVMDNATGDVLALVGGRDARHSTFNRAIAARRQAGSSFKPFVYATAIARGWSPVQVLDDSPYRLVTDGKPWEPSNYDGDFMGPITLRDALVFSRNVPTIRLADDVGEKNIIKLAHTAGIHAELRETPMIALGIAEVSPLELTSAYTSFAGQGTMVEPRFILRVESADGRVLWQPDVRSHSVMDRGVAWVMTDLMRDAVDRGTGRSVRYAGYRGMAAGKTGTTNDGADNWFVGYTPRVTAGIWIGFDKPREIAPKASGAVAAFAWGAMMSRIASWADGSPWNPPDRVVSVSIDPQTGLALEDGCLPTEGEARDEYFLRGKAPEASCPERVADVGKASWYDRALAWAGQWIDRIQERRGDRLAAASSREDREQEAVSRSAPEPVRPDDSWRGRSRPVPGEWQAGNGDEWVSQPDVDWAGNMADALRDAIDQQRDHEDEVVDWLTEIADQLKDRLDRRDARRVDDWLESALRTFEDARRESRRNDRQQIDAWLQEARARSGNGNRLSEQQRAEIERQAREALRSLRILDREIIIGNGHR